MSDLISRQAAIDAVSRGCKELRGIFAECKKNLNELPSVQPNVHDLSKDADCISRQAAIDALKGLPTWWADEGGYYGGAQPPMVALLDPEDAVSVIENLPSAQPNVHDLPKDADCISRHAAIDALDSIGSLDTDADMEYAREVFEALPSVQPEPEWGLPVSINRPLSDQEIIPRLREIQGQIGGSYAIDRAIELIEAIAERRTDGRD